MVDKEETTDGGEAGRTKGGGGGHDMWRRRV